MARSKSSRFFNAAYILLLVSLFLIPNVPFAGFSFGIYDLLCILFVPCLLFSQKPKFQRSITLFIFFICFSLFSLFLNVCLSGTFGITSFLRLFRLAYYPVVLLLFRGNVSIKRSSLSNIFLLLILLNSILSLIVFAVQYDGFGITEMFIFNNQYLYRNGGIFGEANSYAVFCSFEIFLLLLLVFNFKKSLGRSLIWCLDFALVLVNLFLTDSRTGFFSTALCVVLFILISRISNGKKTMLLVLGLSAVFALFLVSPKFNSYITGRIFTGQNLTDYSSGRLYVWSSGFADWAGSGFFTLLFGKGFCLSDGASNMYLTDNVYLNVLFSTGLIGFILFVCWIYLSYKENRSRMFRLLFLMFLFAGLFLDIITSTRLLIFLSLFLANGYQLEKPRAISPKQYMIYMRATAECTKTV